MALIYCPECGKQISDRAAACPNCGCPIEHKQESYAQAVPQYQPVEQTIEKPVKKPKRGLIVVLVLCILAGALGLFFRTDIKQAIQYSNAMSSYKRENYKDALDTLEGLDSDKAKYLRIKCRYYLGAEELEKDNIEKAAEYFYGIDYLDSRQLYKMCKYSLGLDAYNECDWANAASIFESIDYEDSKGLLTDCQFILDLEEAVKKRMDLEEKSGVDKRKLISTEMSILEKYEDAPFYTSEMRDIIEQYKTALGWQQESLTTDSRLQAQYDWQAGNVRRLQILSGLYEYGDFLKNNTDFIRNVVNRLDYEEKWLEAFNDLEDNGHEETKKGKFTNYIELYYKNNTPYTSSQVFEFWFYKDEAETKYLDKTTVLVEDIGPYQEYTVRVDVPASVKNNNYYVSYNYYFDEIKID